MGDLKVFGRDSPQQGGRGLIQLELTFKIVTVGLETYLRESKDEMMKLVLEHEKKKKLCSVTKEATKFCRELGIDQPKHKDSDSITDMAKEVTSLVKKTRKRTDENEIRTETAARSVLEKIEETRY